VDKTASYPFERFQTAANPLISARFVFKQAEPPLKNPGAIRERKWLDTDEISKTE
jgi:hypothetical protein